MAATNLINCCFLLYDPKDDHIISLLNEKLENKPNLFDPTTHLDLYSDHPSTLLQNIQPVIKRTKEHAIYTSRYHKEGSTEINRRVSGGRIGMWKQVSDFECVLEFDKNWNWKLVGKVTRFVFFQGDVDVGNLRKTVWSMKEFITLNDAHQFAICKVTDQPLRDENGDEDEEEDDDDDDNAFVDDDDTDFVDDDDSD